MKKAHCREVWHLVRLVAAPQHASKESLTSAHAEAAFCLECCSTIPYRVGQTNKVVEHVEKYHREKIAEYNASKAAGKRTQSDDKEEADRGGKKTKTLREVSREEQQQANRLLAKWVAQSQRPISIVEDAGFREFVTFVSAEIGGVHVQVPGRTDTRRDIVKLARDLRTKLESIIARDCLDYLLTTDIWTDRRQRSFIAVTIHNLDINFDMANWTLEVESFPGSHTGSAIAARIDDIASRWGLQKGKCAVLLRDGASNAVLAADTLGVYHLSCFAH
eukprot:jgi/Phyca11/117540/e_gw1.33.411.1